MGRRDNGNSVRVLHWPSPTESIGRKSTGLASRAAPKSYSASFGARLGLAFRGERYKANGDKIVRCIRIGRVLSLMEEIFFPQRRMQ
ncbi:hypothetical protein KM043_001518 [Ampulex compressa]|nr:hypothetical protein KM043_001518 [Ampulex compressa]